MSNNNFEVSEGTTFRDLCAEIIQRSTAKKNQLDTLFTDVRSHIKNVNDVQVFLPRIKELLDVGVKNDEQLIKLASVVQRLQSAQLEASGGDSGGLSEEEKEQLIENSAREKINEIKKEIESSLLPLTSSIA